MPTLRELLTLHPTGDGWRTSGAEQANRSGFLYGGQLLAQALCTAISTVPDKRPHALQASFVQPARVTIPTTYRVDDSFDGRKLSSRRVSGSQSDNVVVYCTASFHAEEAGFTHQRHPIDAPSPESLEPLSEIAVRHGAGVSEHGKGRLSTYAQVEVRPIDVEEHLLLRSGGSSSRFWIRAVGQLPEESAKLPAVLAYLSDYLLVNAALIPHVAEIPNERLFVASLNHSVWFHSVADPSQWMLYESVSPWAANGRALSFGHIYDEDGRMVASVAQEALIRTRVSPAAPTSK